MHVDKILALDYILELDIKNWKQVITATTSTLFQGYKIKWCTLNLFQLQLFNLQQCCCSTDGANSVPLKRQLFEAKQSPEPPHYVLSSH